MQQIHIMKKKCSFGIGILLIINAAGVTHTVNNSYYVYFNNDALATTNGNVMDYVPSTTTYPATNDGTVTIGPSIQIVSSGTTIGIEPNKHLGRFGDNQTNGTDTVFTFNPIDSISADGYTVLSHDLSFTFDQVVLHNASGNGADNVGSLDLTADGVTTNYEYGSNWATREIIDLGGVETFSTALASGWSYSFNNVLVTVTGTVELEAVPEPSSLILLCLGATSLIIKRRR